MRASLAISSLPEVLTQRNFVAEFHRENVSFTRKLANSLFLATPFWGLMGNVCDSSLARWKADSRLSKVIIQHFSVVLQLRH